MLSEHVVIDWSSATGGGGLLLHKHVSFLPDVINVILGFAALDWSKKVL